jgi:hypothetical protein
MGAENLAYALTQVVHNFGAVGVLGGAVFAVWPDSRLQQGRKLAWLIFGAWSAQILSGASFGATSLYYYGKTPDLSSIATAALAIKVAAALAGVSLAVWYLRRGGQWAHADAKRAFLGLAVLAALALTAAAFLRWVS